VGILPINSHEALIALPAEEESATNRFYAPLSISSYWTPGRPLILVDIKQCESRQCRPDADVRATNISKEKDLALNNMKENAALLTDFPWLLYEITLQ
jgi:hypothetical protein